MNKELLLEKYIKVAVRKALKEQEEQQRRVEKAMYLAYRFPGLKDLMTKLMSPAFGRFVSGINVVAPKPTTFNISLVNGQDFTIKYIGNKKWNVKVSGRQYHPDNIGEEERCSQAIADLLELNYAPAQGKEQTSATPETGGSEPSAPSPSEPGAAELGPDLAAAEEEPTPAPEETPAEA